MARLFSLDVATGKPDPKFADRGMLDLRRGITEKFPDLRYYLTSPVAVCGDVVIAGSRVSDGEAQGPPGDIRGFDAPDRKAALAFSLRAEAGRIRQRHLGRAIPGRIGLESMPGPC